MANFPELLKVFGKDLVIQAAPGIAEGVINQFFHELNVDMAKVTDYVQHNRSLWNELKPEYQEQLRDLALRLGSLDFITPGLVIHATKKDFPAIASLFLNWADAGYWLERQLSELRERAKQSPQSSHPLTSIP
jgi:hypothetical protein